ncbi:unnamed protein product [Staurois parvus]|uniref:Uncharacterized protein n=1 Tax=Staurois parvus TaxID=386267 RepID=A0ABN9E4L3_9NEOB|nr:unnamed protein product [Staurois parvus]
MLNKSKTLHLVAKVLVFSKRVISNRGGLTIWKLGHCLRAQGQ